MKLPFTALAAAFAVATLALAAPRPALAQVSSVTPIDRIVAIVDEDVVLQSELDRDVSSVLAQFANSPQQLPPRDVLERQVLERLILQKLQLVRADGTGVRVSDAEVDRSMAQVAQQNGLDLSQLRGALAQQGLDYDQFRRNVHDQLLVQALRQRVAQSRSQVTDAEVDSLIRNGALHGGQLHLGYIVVNVPDGATPDQVDEAHRRAEEAKSQIDGGMDFAAAAIRYSNAQNALQGGDLGWRSRDELPPALADAADRLQEGQVSPPMRGPNGFHIIKLIGKRDGNAAQMVTEYHARHILLKPSELVSMADAHAKAEAVRAKIAAGEDFEKAAKENSQDEQTARLGGDLGWFSGTAYGSRIAEQLQHLQPGQVSQPFETDVGWHILQLVDTRSVDKSGELQRDQARNILYQRKAEDEYEAFLRQLRSEAYIEIRLPGGNAPSKPAS